jgi:hypothetical protein
MTGDLAAIVAFIEARLAEDKHYAQGLMFACRIPEKKPDFYACGGPAAEAYWAHFGPARMLRDVEAGHLILARHHADERGMCAACPVDTAADPDYEISECPELRDLASRWSDHPEFQEGWKP